MESRFLQERQEGKRLDFSSEAELGSLELSSALLPSSSFLLPTNLRGPRRLSDISSQPGWDRGPTCRCPNDADVELADERVSPRLAQASSPAQSMKAVRNQTLAVWAVESPWEHSIEVTTTGSSSPVPADGSLRLLLLLVAYMASYLSRE
ncbi:hypothetical protein ABZP36_021676 [Zizania latifolia]